MFKSSVFYSHINICIQTKIPAKLAHNKLVCKDHYRLDLLVTRDSQSSQHSLHLVLKLSRPCIRLDFINIVAMHHDIIIMIVIVILM